MLFETTLRLFDGAHERIARLTKMSVEALAQRPEPARGCPCHELTAAGFGEHVEPLDKRRPLTLDRGAAKALERAHLVHLRMRQAEALAEYIAREVARRPALRVRGAGREL